MSLNTNFDATGNVVQKDNRMIAGILVVVAIVGLAFALVSKRWLANSRGRNEMGFGLLSFSACIEGMGSYSDAELRSREPLEPKCVDRSNSSVVDEIKANHGEASGAFPIFGYITLGAIAVTLLGLLGSLPLAFGKKEKAAVLLHKFPMAPTTLALLAMTVALITGCVFVATKPGGVGAVGVGWGFWAFAVAIITGMLGAIMIAKGLAAKAADAEWQA
ncbi:MAG TPA: hypothetical protein PLF40_13485 [Kofleriaceae bacterium]|nr:hypothetical protein [Kofleriaceae bacterium]